MKNSERSGRKNNAKKETIVEKVIDGDTVETEGGIRVRYIGIDTPETDKKECYASQAAEKNKQLVLNKEVVLEKDVSETDDYNRLLRYIYLDGVLINELLIKEGYAKSVPISPDTKYQSRFWAAQQEAQKNNSGLWGECY